MEDIGFRIQKLREEKGYSQDQLAEKLFVSRQTISNYERNKSQPSLEMLEKIADIFDTDLASLLSTQTDGQRDRKRAVLRLILEGSIGLVLVIAYHVLYQIAMKQRNLYFDTRLQFWLSILLRPCLWAFGGYFLLSILTTVFHIRIPKKKCFFAVDLLAGFWIVFYLTVMFPFLFQMEVPRNWSNFAYWLLKISHAHLVLPFALGAAMRICRSRQHLPKTK